MTFMTSQNFFVIFCSLILLTVTEITTLSPRCPSDDPPSVFDCGPHLKCPKDFYCFDGFCCPNCLKHNQLNTKTQHQRSCDPDGHYSTVQCNNRSNVCWCSTPQGKVLKGTLARADKFRSTNSICNNDEFSDQKISEDFISQCSNSNSNCLSNCNKDQDCDSKKCCFTGCSYRCLEQSAAVRQDVIRASSLSRCPNVAQLSIAQLSQAAACQVNEDCPSFLLCCPTLMGSRCLMDNPQLNTGIDKPGWCPLISSASMGASLAFSQSGCINDGDCPLNQKCCLLYSGNYCTQPVQDGAQQSITSTAYNIPFGGQVGVPLMPFPQQAFCQLENEEYRQCGDLCEMDCSNIGSPCPVIFPVTCGPPACFCRPGFIRSTPAIGLNAKSACVPISQCGFSMSFPFANNGQKAGLCPQGLLSPMTVESISRGKSPACMNDAQCPGESKCCPITDPSSPMSLQQRCLCVDPFAYYKECVSTCPETCPNTATLSRESMCRSSQRQFACEPGCACMDGYVRASYVFGSHCMPLSKCVDFGTLPQAYNRNGGTLTAVARFVSDNPFASRLIDGIVSFEQSSENNVHITGQIRNLPQGRQRYSLQIVENADSQCPVNPNSFNNGRFTSRFSNFDQRLIMTRRPLAMFNTDLEGYGRINGATSEIFVNDDNVRGLNNNFRMKVPILNRMIGIFPFVRNSAANLDRALACAYVTV